MLIRVVTIRNILCFLTIVFLVFSFPIQVYTKSVLPSLIPYFLILILFISRFINNKTASIFNDRFSKINMSIYLYLLFFSSKILFDFLYFNSSFELLLSNTVIYLLPTVFYFYFSGVKNEGEINSTLYSIIFASFLSGIFYLYDSYLKFALFDVSNYAIASHEYSLSRLNQVAEEANEARIRPGFKSFGLLESHSVSGSWLLLGLFASLTVLPYEKYKTRLFSILIFGLFLIVGLTFTSIVIYFLTLILYEARLISIIFGSISRKAFKSMFTLFSSIFIIVLIIFSIVGEEMSTSMIDLFTVQKNFIYNNGESEQPQSMILANKISFLINRISVEPWLLLFGDRINNPFKGGDVGFLDTIVLFGLFPYLLLIFGFYKLFKISIITVRQEIWKKGNTCQANRLSQFVIYMITLILISDIHYSIWGAKSILPIIFLSLAMYDKSILFKRECV
jgi:hypothetical protein